MQVVIPEAKQVQALWEQAPEIVGSEQRRAMQESVEIGQEEIVERTPTNRGRLRTGIHTFIAEAGSEIAGFVRTQPLAYAEVMEYGRDPGKFPPIDAIARWVHDKGIGGEIRTISRGPRKGTEYLKRAPKSASRRIAFLIARKIAKEGIEGKFMFRDGGKAAEPAIRARWTVALSRIAMRMATQ